MKTTLLKVRFLSLVAALLLAVIHVRAAEEAPAPAGAPNVEAVPPVGLASEPSADSLPVLTAELPGSDAAIVPVTEPVPPAPVAVPAAAPALVTEPAQPPVMAAPAPEPAQPPVSTVPSVGDICIPEVLRPPGLAGDVEKAFSQGKLLPPPYGPLREQEAPVAVKPVPRNPELVHLPQSDAFLHELQYRPAMVTLPKLAALKQRFLGDPRLKKASRRDKSLAALLKRGVDLPALYAQDAGVSEGYTIGQHTVRVLDAYEEQKKFFSAVKLRFPGMKKDFPIDPFMKTVLSFHDIGKGLAVKAGNKSLQHFYTRPLINSLMRKAGYGPAATRLAVALVDNDLIGDLLTGRKTPAMAAKGLRAQARKAGIGLETYVQLQYLYYVSDASAYPGLREWVFRSEGGKLLPENPAFATLMKTLGIKSL